MKKRLQLSCYVTGDVCADCGHLRHARGFFSAVGMEERLADCCPKCGSTNGTKKVVGRVLYDEGGGGMAAYWRSVEGFYPQGEEPIYSEAKSDKKEQDVTNWKTPAIFALVCVIFVWAVVLFAI